MQELVKATLKSHRNNFAWKLPRSVVADYDELYGVRVHYALTKHKGSGRPEKYMMWACMHAYK